MPLYYKGDRELPRDKLVLDPESLSVLHFERLVSTKKGRFHMSVSFSSFPENSLGYVFIVEEKNNLYSVLDIKDVTYFRGVTVDYLLRIVRHASGVEYDLEIQSEFHRIRNEIGLD